jgi:hypothetical protein
MALASIQAALDQYNANLSWQLSASAAQAALEAVRYLLMNRPQKQADQGSELNYESLAIESRKLETFLGVSAPRAFGRSRVNVARFCDGSGCE